MLFGVKINSTAVIPAEFCQIVKGQIYKKKVPPELMKQVLDFAVKPPTERLNNVLDGVRGRVSDPIFVTFELLMFNVFGQFLNYSQSDFIGRIGMQIDEAPMMIQGRQLPSPAIHYGNQVVINQRVSRPLLKQSPYLIEPGRRLECERATILSTSKAEPLGSRGPQWFSSTNPTDIFEEPLRLLSSFGYASFFLLSSPCLFSLRTRSGMSKSSNDYLDRKF